MILNSVTVRPMLTRCFDRFPDQVNIDGFKLEHFGCRIAQPRKPGAVNRKEINPRNRSAQGQSRDFVRILSCSVRRQRSHDSAELAPPRCPEIRVVRAHAAATPNRIRMAGPQPITVKKKVA